MPLAKLAFGVWKSANSCQQKGQNFVGCGEFLGPHSTREVTSILHEFDHLLARQK